MEQRSDSSLTQIALAGVSPTWRRWVVVVTVLLALGAVSIPKLGFHAAALDVEESRSDESRQGMPATDPSPSRVAGRGRLAPVGGVIHLAGPARQPAVVAQLEVREGDWVEAGQVIAVLDGVPALQANVRRLEAMARNAESESRRFAPLCREGIASAIECDAVRMRLDGARADLERAAADLDTVYVRAPRAGRILRVHTEAGERIGGEGIVELGDTRQMEVVAEIYEADVPLLRHGQVVRISSPVLEEELAGSVERIGLSVHKQSVFDIDPVASADARIVEARIRVADGIRVAHLTNLQVEVEIQLEGGRAL